MSDSMLESRIIDILDAIREVLGRLATLEEKTLWHNNVMKDLADDQRRVAERLSDHEKDRSRIAMLERDNQYLSGELGKNAKQLEVLTGIISEIQKNDISQGRTVGFIERSAGALIMAILSAGGGAIAMKLIGG